MDTLVFDQEEHKLNLLKIKKSVSLIFSLILLLTFSLFKLVVMNLRKWFRFFLLKEININYRDTYYLRDAEIKSYVELKA